ncbi:MAG: FIG005666: putative helicase [uncultured Thermomicrobiales bacterium]|uniref:FIG005666: putative helicase n=1 Tax=uncultured Thermomicrobiales bacterium TaxID=1645740 RepID=A0A6J4UQH9_9BACT|nr:MAG: FIG005666: putative helicase [uncultured Thermomicrobiales bacterium]
MEIDWFVPPHLRAMSQRFDPDTRASQGSAATEPVVNANPMSRIQSIPEVEIDAAIDQFNVFYPFPLDTFQREAIRTLLHGDSVMVAAPTGSGKTVVAEFGIYDAFRRTGRVLYTAPIKALSNQKFRDLRTIYGADVGLLTGDISENRDARIIVMTTEILRNMLLQTPWELDDVECIIFDEIHYLADPDRGTTWEESIILCPDHIQLICLSATVTNASEIAGWIGRTHRDIRLITHNERPVPLALYYFYEDELATVIDHTGVKVRDFSRVGGESRRQSGRSGRRQAPARGLHAQDEPQPREIVDALAKDDLLPAIYFLFSRNDCRAYAEQLAMMRPKLVAEHQHVQIEQILDTYLGVMRPEDRALDQVEVVCRLARCGIGFHHAGLLPILKQLVEVLFVRGLMQVVFATDTLALGVNMPARTVVIGRMTKWDGRRRRTLIPNEFQQMAGRAGRRGMDEFGHVVMPYSPMIPFRDMLAVATGDLHPVQSAFAIRYNTVLNLWDPPDGDRVRQMLRRSLAQYQTGQRIRMIEADIVEIEAEIAGISDGRREEISRLDDSFEEFRSIQRRLQTAQHDLRRIQQDLASARLDSTTSTPWTEPGRQALRRLFRTVVAGVVVHVRELGWCIFLGRGAQGGVGLFLSVGDARIHLVTEYRQVDFIPLDDVVVQLPGELIEPADAAVDPSALIGREALESLFASVASRELPDLDRLVREHRARESARLAAIVQELVEAESAKSAEIGMILELRDAHPFADTRRRKDHQTFLTRRDTLHKERNALAEVLEREIEAEDLRIRGVIRGIRDVLHRFGYLRQGYPTAKADMLADVFDTDGLILCELVDRGTLDHLEPDELAELFSWYSFDREYRGINHFTLPDRLILARRRLEDLERDVLAEERDLKLFISEGHNAHFYGAALHWSRGWTMAKIGEYLELSEGDLVITFNKTIDLMRQVREMLGGVQPDHPLRQTLATAEKRLRRGIVEQSLSLGFTPIADATEPDDDPGPEDRDNDTVADAADAIT